METVKRIPYGVSDFVEVMEQNQYYVDKTMCFPLLEQQPSSLFLIRPRRFGKSLFLSMLRAKVYSNCCKAKSCIASLCSFGAASWRGWRRYK